MNYRNYIFFCILLLSINGAKAQESWDEFSGPLPGWANVKTRFGAKGDGKADDGRALQKALDSLSVFPKQFNTGKTAYVVLYLPAGTYRISETLVLKGKIGVSIIGEDPAKTTIVWTGADKDTMLWANGSAYFKIARLKWVPGKAKGMEAIGLHWKDKWRTEKSQSFAALNIEIADCIFEKGLAYGISGGTMGGDDGTGHNDSEVAIRRCSFYNCTESGILIRGYNALDYWIWDCRFFSCARGIYNRYGNYHVYRSYFSRSSIADLHNMHGYYISARDCYSFRSRMFSADEGQSCNPFKRVFTGNKVVGNSDISIMYMHLGKITLMDNCFGKTADSTYKINLNYNSWCPGNYEVLSLNNNFEYKADPFRIPPPRKEVIQYRDSFSVKPSFSDTAVFLAGLQKTPVLKTRRIFNVPVNSNAAAIQQLINTAVKYTGSRPILYFPSGNYRIDQPLTVPAGADVQLIGDGLIYASVLMEAPGFPDGKSLITIYGPTNTSIRDLHLGQNSSKKSRINAITFINVDQKNSGAVVDQLYSSATSSINLEKLSNLRVQNENSFFCEGNRVIGDNAGGTALLSSYGGQFMGVQVENGGRFLAKDCWWEGGLSRVPVWDGSGAITIDGAMIAPNTADQRPVIRVGKFKGKITLMNMYLQGAMELNTENPDFSIFGWNLHFYHKVYPLSILVNPKYKCLFAGLTAQCFSAADPICKEIQTVDDMMMNVSNREAFILDQVKDDRIKPMVNVKRSASWSSVFISRVTIGNCDKGIVFGK